MGLYFAALCGPLGGRAATVWSGPTTAFINQLGSDPSQPANQDRLTANVWITRGSSMGIYNAATETGYSHSLSPQNTAWSDGALANYASLTYVDWETWAKGQHGGPPNTVGVNAVVHLVSDDIYLSVTFTSWGGDGGGFSYVQFNAAFGGSAAHRGLVTPTNGASFTAPATVPITATASDSGRQRHERVVL